MEIKKCIKDSFSVIGKEGSTNDGDGFIQRLWEDASNHYHEIAALVKTGEDGNPVGFWGAMSDFSKSFKPWEDNLSKGIYLAGAEVKDDAEVPDGWIKWTVPSSEFLCVKVENGAEETIPAMMKYLEDNNLKLAGAINDFLCLEENMQLYMFFPICRL